jgi:hypothetical protein
MPLTLGGWSESVDQAALDGIAAIADETLRVAGDAIIVPSWAPTLYGVYANGVNLTRARINAPSLQDVVRPSLEPLNVSAEPTFPLPWHWFGDKPYTLKVSENLEVETAEDGAGATRMNAFAWLGTGIVPLDQLPPTEGVEGGGERQSLRATGTTTLGTFAWTPAQLTFDDPLQAGYYAVIGAFPTTAGLIAARINIPGLNTYRMGCVGADAVGDVGEPMFRNGRLGIWGVFDQDIGLSMDFCSISADTAETVVFDAIYLGEDRPVELIRQFQVAA